MTTQNRTSANIMQDDQIDQAKPVISDKSAQQAQRSSRRARKSTSAFKTISEVADLLDVQQHVLRFWETKFSQIRPLKRGGGRRYYRPEDVDLLKSIHYLLYTEGYTIKGVQKLLREQGKNQVVQNNQPEQEAKPAPAEVAAVATATQPEAQAVQQQNTVLAPQSVDALRDTLAELKDLRRLITTSE